MKPPEEYRGREQTYVKHFFLESYLERVAYNILSSRNGFVYVDGFSGPWKAADEAFDDTSFMIAVRQLRAVRRGIKDNQGRDIRIRCFFVEANPTAFQELERSAAKITDMEVKTLPATFEDAVPDIVNYAGQEFSLTFIDPTGWTGYAMNKIKPLLNLRGEVLINFMFDHLNRFLEDPRPSTAASYNDLFGDPHWYDKFENLVADGIAREEAVLNIYLDCLRITGGFTHVTSTRILKPLSDRSYFHLVYGTRHLKGLREFRAVEKKMMPEQERVRTAAREEKTGQTELFAGDVSIASYQSERIRRCESARHDMERLLAEQGNVLYEELLAKTLETPLVWESDVKSWIKELRQADKILLPNLAGRQSVPKIGHRIQWNA
jgi:three-Cys-motif partner protein